MNVKLFGKFKELSKRQKVYIIAIVLILFILIWAFVAACIITGKYNFSHIKEAADSQKVDAVGLIITETKNGSKYFEIYGENGTYGNDKKFATLNNVVGNFYKDGEVAMSFQSSKGTYDENLGVIKLYNNTYIVLKDETSLEADSLIWSGSDKDTVAEGNVKIKKGGKMAANANKCIIGAGYNKFRIVGKTRTNIYSNKEK